MNSKLKKIYWIGNILAFLGIGFVAWKIWEWRDQLFFSQLGLGHYAVLAGLALLSFAFSILLVVAWRYIMRHLGQQMPFRLAFNLYGSSQIAKYVPGNVAQFIARQAMGRYQAFTHRALALSSLWEIILLVAASAVYVFWLLPYADMLGFLAFLKTPYAMAVGLFVAVILISYIVLQRVFSNNLAKAILVYYIFMLSYGIIFTTIILKLANAQFSAAQLTLFFCSAIFAYLAGLVTPGAPAGLGIRESVLIYILHNMLSPEVIIMAVLLWRCVTIIGDIMLYLFSVTIFRPASKMA